MAKWLIWSLAATFLWGLWAIFAKLAMRDAAPVGVLFFFLIGEVVTAAAIIGWYRPIAFPGTPAAVFAVASGAAGALAMLAFFIAVRQAALAVVLPLTSLYPVVAIAIGILVLGEKITPLQSVGAVLAVAAFVLLSR